MYTIKNKNNTHRTVVDAQGNAVRDFPIEHTTQVHDALTWFNTWSCDDDDQVRMVVYGTIDTGRFTHGLVQAVRSCQNDDETVALLTFSHHAQQLVFDTVADMCPERRDGTGMLSNWVHVRAYDDGEIAVTPTTVSEGGHEYECSIFAHGVQRGDKGWSLLHHLLAGDDTLDIRKPGFKFKWER